MSKIARQGLKPLTIAYKDIAVENFEDLQSTFGNFESAESHDHLNSGLCLVATFGFEDAIRSGVKETIDKLRQTNTITRVISGDHKDTVIYTLNELNLIERDQIECVISGKELSERMEGIF